MIKSKLLLLLLTISYLMQKYPDSVRAQSVSRGYSDSSSGFSLSRLVGASARGKIVEHNNGSGDVGGLRRSERISSSAQSVEQSARRGKSRGRSAARNGASSGAISGCAGAGALAAWASTACLVALQREAWRNEIDGCATQQTPTDWNSPISPRSSTKFFRKP